MAGGLGVFLMFVGDAMASYRHELHRCVVVAQLHDLQRLDEPALRQGRRVWCDQKRLRWGDACLPGRILESGFVPKGEGFFVSFGHVAVIAGAPTDLAKKRDSERATLLVFNLFGKVLPMAVSEAVRQELSIAWRRHLGAWNAKPCTKIRDDFFE